MIRVDMAERIAAHAHEAQAAVDPALVTSLGLKPETVTRLMREIGFAAGEGQRLGLARAGPRPQAARRKSRPRPISRLWQG